MGLQLLVLRSCYKVEHQRLQQKLAAWQEATKKEVLYMKTLNPINKVCVVYGAGKSVIVASSTLGKNRGEAASVEVFPGTGGCAGDNTVSIMLGNDIVQ